MRGARCGSHACTRVLRARDEWTPDGRPPPPPLVASLTASALIKAIPIVMLGFWVFAAGRGSASQGLADFRTRIAYGLFLGSLVSVDV
jgi:hypothetical protein